MSARTDFQDCQVNDRLVTSGRTLTATDVQLFTGLSTVATNEIPAMLTLTTALGLLFRDSALLPKSVLALTNLHTVRFERPVAIGDTIRLDCAISALKRVRGQSRALVEVAFQALNQRDELVLSGRLGVLAGSMASA